MGLFDDVFGGGAGSAAHAQKKAQQRAMEEYQGAWGDEQGYLNPQLGGRFGGMTAQQAMLDPNQFYSNIMSGYEMSPAAQREMASGQEALRNQMAAAGLSGSSNAMRDAAHFARDFTSNDMQRYFQNQMGIFGQGMGIGNNLASFRDLLGQRMGQGRIGIGQAEAQGALSRGQALQNAIATGIGAFGGGMGYGPYSGGLQGAFQGMGFMPTQSQGLQGLAQLLGMG